jgi:DNA replication protein DnaC
MTNRLERLDEIDFELGTVQGAVAERIASLKRTGLSDTMVVMLFVSGSNYDFKDMFKDEEDLVDFIKERDRLKEIIQQHGIQIPASMGAEIKDDPDVTSAEAEFRRVFGMSAHQAFKGPREFIKEYAQEPRYQVMEWIRQVADRKAPLKCFLAGPSQRGKTYCLRFAGMKILKNGASLAYVSVPSICGALDLGRLSKNQEEYDHFHSFVGLLEEAIYAMIDDIGAERQKYKEHIEDIISRIMEKRNGEGKPTLIATNLTAKQMSERYDERMLGRLNDGGVLTVPFGVGYPDFQTWKGEQSGC